MRAYDDSPGDADRRPGRPPKLTPATVKLAVALALRGNFRYAVARRVGVHPKTFERWMRAGKRSPAGLYGQLRAGVLRAEAEFEIGAVAEVVEAAKSDAKFACWMLERKYPQRWGRYRGGLGELKRRVREMERSLGTGSE